MVFGSLVWVKLGVNEVAGFICLFVRAALWSSDERLFRGVGDSVDELLGTLVALQHRRVQMSRRCPWTTSSRWSMMWERKFRKVRREKREEKGYKVQKKWVLRVLFACCSPKFSKKLPLNASASVDCDVALGTPHIVLAVA